MRAKRRRRDERGATVAEFPRNKPVSATIGESSRTNTPIDSAVGKCVAQRNKKKRKGFRVIPRAGCVYSLSVEEGEEGSVVAYHESVLSQIVGTSKRSSTVQPRLIFSTRLSRPAKLPAGLLSASEKFLG